MSKTLKIVIASSVALALIAAIVCMVLFIPLQGKPRNEVWTYADKYDAESVASIEMSGDEFTILQLTDIQLWSNAADNKAALEMVKTLVKDVQPDLVAMTGDQVSGLMTDALLNDLIDVMNELDVYWAPVFGNHDREGRATLDWQGDRLMEAEKCLFKHGPTNITGVGNYAVNVTKNGEIVETLIFLDSGEYREIQTGMKREGYIEYDQLAFYKWNILGASAVAGRQVPSMAFMHYALPEFYNAMVVSSENHDTLGDVPASFAGGSYTDSDGNIYTTPAFEGSGSIGETMCPQRFNSGMYDMAVELGTTDFFFGHDHANDAIIRFVDSGIRMSYGLKVGPSPEPWNDAVRYGGTVIKFDADGNSTVTHKVVQTL